MQKWRDGNQHVTSRTSSFTSIFVFAYSDSFPLIRISNFEYYPSYAFSNEAASFSILEWLV